MNLIDLLVYISNEEKAEEYLKNINVLYNFKKCIYCSGSSLGYIRRGKVKCYSCNREWNRRKGSMVEKYRISFPKFILLLKLFALNIPQVTISKEIGVSRNVIGKVIKDIRNEIIQNEFEKMDRELSSCNFNKGRKIILYITDNKIKIGSATSHITKFNVSEHLSVSILRKKNNNFEYFYIFSVKLVSNPSDVMSKNQTASKWSELKNDLIKYKGRNLNLMLRFLFELIFRNNNKDQIFQKIINEIRVADNQQTRKIIDKKVRI